MMLPVTVIIPTYNGTRYIAEALRSVFAQTLLPNEVIVVDDHSTDDTVDVVQAEACGAPVPVRILRHPCNSGGPARPINTGIASANTDLITVLDQDDLFLPDKLESQVSVLSNNPDVAWTAGFCTSKDGPRSEPHWQLRAYNELVLIGSANGSATFFGRDVLRTLLLRGNFLVGYPAVMFRAADWRAKGGVDERFSVASDFDLFCWLCRRGRVVLQPQIQYVRREHDANVSSNHQKAFLEMTRVRGRYLTQDGWLLEDKVVVDSMREWFTGFSYWLREAGNYRGAWECYLLTAGIWGWDRSLIAAACKLPFHWLRRAVTKNPPTYNGYTRSRDPLPQSFLR